MKKKIDPEPLVPNAKTIEAMKAARRDDLASVGAPENLLLALLDASKDMKDGGVFNDAGLEKIIVPELGAGDDAAKLEALRAAAKTGTDEIGRAHV